MQIKLVNLLVDDQDKALQFYTEKLGFEKSADVDFGPLRWLTVVSPDGAPGVELQFEKTDFPPARAYQKARYEAGIPILGLNSLDIQADYERLKARSVRVRGEPRNMGVIWSLVFEDGCGNLVHLIQPTG